jgi:hypothetical protein
MLDVLIFAVNNIEKNETTTIDWLNWDEDMKMIIEFDFKACFFVEIIIDSIIDHFVDVSEMKRNDSFRFFLIQITDETR